MNIWHISLIMALLSFSSLGQNVNKARNGDLEKIKGNRPDGWIGWTWAPKKARPEAEVVIIDNVGRNKSRCVKISVKKRGHVGVLSNNYGIINAAGGKKYVLKLYVKTIKEDLAKTLELKISSLAKSSKKCSVRKKFKLFPTQDWQQLVLPITAPEGEQKFRIDIQLQDSGTVFIDDIYFGELEDKEVMATPRPFILAGRAIQPPVVDGKLSDECWQRSIQCGNFSAVNGKGLAQAQTSAWITFDNRNLYIAFHCSEKFLDPKLNQLDRFKANITSHDRQVYYDDSVEIFIQPPESKIPFHMIVNSQGAIFDQIGKKGAESWDSNAKAAGYVGDGFWSAEIVLPLDAIGIKKVTYDKSWRVNFCRSRHTIPETLYSSWAPVSGAFYAPASLGYLNFAGSVPEVKQDSLHLSNNGSNLNGKFYLKNCSSQLQDYYLNYTINASANNLSWHGVNSLQLKANTGAALNFKRQLLNLSEQKINFYKFAYTIESKNTIYYRSPLYKFLVGESAKPISSDFFYYITCGKPSLKKRQKIFIMENSVEKISLILSSSQKNDLKGVTLVIDMPLYCRLIKDCFSSSVNISEKEQVRNGKKYRHYQLQFPSNMITPGDHLKWNFIPVNLFIAAVGASPDTRREGCLYYYTETIPSGYTEKEKNIPIIILPPASQKRSEKIQFKFWNWMPFYNITQFSPFIQNKLLAKWSNAGINSLSVDNQLDTSFHRKILKQYFIKSMKMLPTLTAVPNFPLAKKYLNANPGDSELNADGKPVSLICIADILKGSSPFLLQIDQVLGNMAKTYDILELDYEFGIFRKNAPGYSTRNIQMFRSKNNIPDTQRLTPVILDTQYRKEWLDFRCWQNGEMLRVYRQSIKKHNPKCLLGAYSGYQRPSMSYGVDWRYWAPYLDYVSCGYGRGDYVKTRQAIAPKRLITAGLALFETELNLNDITTRTFRRISDCGSLMLFNGGNIDGRVWRAVSRATSVVADFEEFFLNFKRNDSLIIPQNKDISVLSYKGNHLLFIFNEYDKIRNISFKSNKPANQIVVDYERKQIISPAETLNIVVPANDVKIICLVYPEQFKNNDTLKPQAPGRNGKVDLLRPIFRWNDNYPFNIYNIQCASADKNVINVESITENYFVPSKIFAPGKYKWRVRPQDVISKKYGLWTDWSEFEIPGKRVTAPQIKLPENPSIEKLGNWMPVNWDSWPSNVDAFGKDYKHTRSGSYSLRLTKTDFGAAYWTTMRFCPTGSVLPEVKPGELYKFTAWIKTSGKVKASIGINFKDEYNSHIRGSATRVSECPEWQKISTEVIVPKAAKFLTLGLAVTGSNGDAWFDCFELQKIK